MRKNSTIGNESRIFACLQLCEIALKTKETDFSWNIDGSNIFEIWYCEYLKSGREFYANIILICSTFW